MLPVFVHQRLGSFQRRQQRRDALSVGLTHEWLLEDGHEGGPVQDEVVVVLNFILKSKLNLLRRLLN